MLRVVGHTVRYDKPCVFIYAFHNIDFRMLFNEQEFEYKERLAASQYSVLVYPPYSIRSVQDEEKFKQDIFATADILAMPKLCREMQWPVVYVHILAGCCSLDSITG